MTQDTEVLIRHIIGAAQEEVSREQEKRKKEAESFRESFSKATDEMVQHIVDDFAKKIAEEKRRIISRAEAEAKLRLLRAKQDLIKAVFENVLIKLAGLPEEKKRSLYLKNLLTAAEKGDEQVAVSRAERELWEKLIPEANKKLMETGRMGKLILVSEPAQIAGGFLLTGKNYEVNASLESLLSHAEERLRPEAARMLFG